jgi:hypothetical protein
MICAEEVKDVDHVQDLVVESLVEKEVIIEIEGGIPAREMMDSKTAGVDFKIDEVMIVDIRKDALMTEAIKIVEMEIATAGPNEHVKKERSLRVRQ